MKVSRPSIDNLARDLIRLLRDLIGLHGELAAHMREKIEAMRRAEAGQMAAVLARESALAKRIAEREGLRRQITERLAAETNAETPKVRVRSVSEGPAESRKVEMAGQAVRLVDLAERLEEPKRSQLLAAAAGLRAKLAEMEELRVVTTLITQEMLKHLDAVMTAMTTADPGGEVYGRTGQKQRSGTAHVFEAVG